MQATRSKAEMLAHLRSLLTDVFRLRTQGAAYAKLARAQGCADGYMRAMIDAGLATQRDLLIFVAEQRRIIDGPATEELDIESFQAA
jgi:hypothetical protein